MIEQPYPSKTDTRMRKQEDTRQRIANREIYMQVSIQVMW